MVKKERQIGRGHRNGENKRQSRIRNRKWFVGKRTEKM